jgi:hypothetical protein
MGDLWGTIDRSGWRNAPHMRDRVATEEDVKAGRAVFHFQNLDEVPAWPADVQLPALALWRKESGKQVPVVVIHLQESATQRTAGVRYFDGGNGVCLFDELEFIDETDPQFTEGVV